MLTSKTEFDEILNLAPEWARVLESLKKKQTESDKSLSLLDLFEELGAKSVYQKIVSLEKDRTRFLEIVRDYYYQPLFQKMLISNQNLKRFWIQRRVQRDTQKHNCVSLSVELSQKMLSALEKQLNQNKDDGFKVLLPAYGQRSVYNLVVDYVRREWQWEKDTLQDVNLDPNQIDPRVAVADEIEFSPEHQAISGEQVGQLNLVRSNLSKMLNNPDFPKDALTVVDCMFGMGLTSHSKAGVEMTMRECCDVLNLPGETQARKIARCQVLLDKGLDAIRDMIRSSLPGVTESWQTDVNLNSASRRELNHLLNLTEGEVDRVIKNRQYYSIEELVDKKVVKPERIPAIQERGAVVAFIPVDLNSATRRDIIDITGISKTASKKIVDKRPFSSIKELVSMGILNNEELSSALENGAVLKETSKDIARLNINSANEEELLKVGLDKRQIERFVRARPFQTWAELEDFLCMDTEKWKILRDRACLSIESS